MKRLLILPFLIAPAFAHGDTALQAADPLAKVPDGVYKCTHENASVRCDPYTPVCQQPVGPSLVHQDAQAQHHRHLECVEQSKGFHTQYFIRRFLEQCEMQ